MYERNCQIQFWNLGLNSLAIVRRKGDNGENYSSGKYLCLNNITVDDVSVTLCISG